MIIRCENFESVVELNGSNTTKLIKRALPFSGSAQVWQEEVYFEIPVTAKLENATERVESGDIAYWPNGRCFCIFFGKTQPISAVTVIGKITNNLDKFREVLNGETIVLDTN